ncbi:hypothetical protein GCM10010272_28920 [Streptomyces lateritius]|nr:hypothetical protein GCM10010272_28920 [Streptomyces lateritius]
MPELTPDLYTADTGFHKEVRIRLGNDGGRPKIRVPGWAWAAPGRRGRRLPARSAGGSDIGRDLSLRAGFLAPRLAALGVEERQSEQIGPPGRGGRRCPGVVRRRDADRADMSRRHVLERRLGVVRPVRPGQVAAPFSPPSR